MPAERFEFEDFELDRSAYELRRAGSVVHVERIPLDLLFLLIERRGQLVTRQEIFERIWGEGVFLDTDNSINTAVRKLRLALHDDPDAPHFLVTVAGKGYRFIATVVVTEPSSGTRLPAKTSELSINGCYIDTLNPFPEATLVRLRIIKDDGVFETPGRVLYCHPGFGMGIVFIDSTPDQRALLEGWLAELAAQ